MNDKLKDFYDKIEGKKVAVVGVGISNRPLIELLVKKGAKVTAYDKKTREEFGKTADELEEMGVSLCLGQDNLKDIEADMVFRTPGMRPDLPVFEEARAKGAEITSEMETFFALCPCKIFAVTGSDGKSTTTTLINELLTAEGYRTHLGGNLGRPLLPEIEEIGPEDFCVVELSSFQLFDMTHSPDVAVITNLSPNHLDVHKSMEEYSAAKKNIFLHQKEGDRLVLNADNEVTASFAGEAEKLHLSVSFFSRKKPVNGYFCEGEEIVKTVEGKTISVLTRKGILLPGEHNVENYMAALAATEGYVSPDTARKVAAEFGGLVHRLELVRELDGVKYYNDSIASSPTRTKACFQSFEQKIILIAGGYDKKIPFDDFGKDILEHVKGLVLVGHTAPKIKAAVEAAEGFGESGLPIFVCDTFEQAVKAARDLAKKGDIVALSPACASFDLFKNFEERGNRFKELVRAL